jgi:vacuolar-type H+-ATPase subunit H
MVQLNFLDRFRPVGAPGAAASAGRTDEVRGPAAELAPVFAALAADRESARALVALAEREAERVLTEARERASEMTAQARLDAVTERAAAATAVQNDSHERDKRLVESANKRASALETAAATELTAVAEYVVEKMVSTLLQSDETQDSGERES